MRHFTLLVGMAMNLALAFGSAAMAAPDLLPDDGGLPEPFQGWNAASPFEISYADLDYIYKRSVLAAGGSDRQYAPVVRPRITTRINRSNPNPTRMEGNRVNFDIFRGDNLALISKIRRELEAVPDTVPMANWRRDEQLAYWLNLYNLTVLEQIALEYPVTRIGGLYRDGKGKIWTDKLLTVGGMPLSLNDIRFNILIPKWRNPLIMYGLFDGFVGGPNMRKEAYTAKNVYKQLEENAREFINSNRGVRGDGDILRISALYKFNAALFPEGDSDLKTHFARYANWDLQPRISNARRIRTNVKDLYIADLHGGHKGLTTPANTNAAALFYQGNARGVDPWKLFDAMQPVTRYPVHVQDYMTRLIKRNGENRVGRVLIDEVARGEALDVPTADSAVEATEAGKKAADDPS